MITDKGDTINITIDKDALEQSMAWLEDLREFCQKTKEAKAHVGYIQTALETCQAFWCEYFAEEDI